MTPTARTKALLEKEGYLVAIVEHWNPWAKIRQDLFGFADLIGVNPQSRTVTLVQTCSDTDHARRRRKVLESEAAAICAKAGVIVSVISWGKRKEKGTNRLTWTPRVEVVRFGEAESA